MNNNADFNDKIVLDYDENIARVVPGYALMTSVAVAYCQSHLTENARILVVGAGTGNELEKLCQANPTWAFTAVEPAEAMLKQAKMRCTEYQDRIHWHHGTLETLEKEENSKPFDACVCLLLIHFLTEADKQQLLGQIAEITKSELILSQRLLVENEAFLDSEVSYALSRGHPQEKYNMLKTRLLDLPSITEVQAQTLYMQCGFCKPRTLVQVFSYQLTSLKVRNE